MAWIEKLLGLGDPYENGEPTAFIRKGTFTTETVGGYKVCYTVVCNYGKRDYEQFKAAQMLEEENRDRFVALVDEQLVKPAFKRGARFWRLHARRYQLGELYCFVKEGDKLGVYRDHSCLELNKELENKQLEAWGCVAKAHVVLCNQSEELIEENYKRMIRICNADAVEHTGKYMIEEESILVAAAKRALDLEKDSLKYQSNQTHTEGDLTVTTRLVGRALEITWKLGEPLTGSSLYGYAKQGGFWTGKLPLENNGTCIVETGDSGSVVMRLAEGVQHFLTFVRAWQGEKEWHTAETLRFSVRLPTVEELTHVERLLLTIQANEQKSTMSKKTSAAVQELLSFVEFEESISGVEKELIERISGKSYTPEEKADKIDRLKSVVESLRAANS